MVWMEVINIIDHSCCYLILLDRGSITKSMQESERGMRKILEKCYLASIGIG